MCCNSHSMIRNAIDAGNYRSAKRTAAAMKGWQTRRANAIKYGGVVEAPDGLAVMTFGGTLPVSQTSVKEIERVPA